jgi:hypothetical protein
VFAKSAGFGHRCASVLRDISNDDANRDDGARWPNAFAMKEMKQMTAAEEARISALVSRAVS